MPKWGFGRKEPHILGIIKVIGMIKFENVTKYYNENVGLEHATIHIEKGDFVFLVGPSGAGKSTFIKLIMKEINADEGRIVVDGQDVTRLSSREIPKLKRILKEEDSKAFLFITDTHETLGEGFTRLT